MTTLRHAMTVGAVITLAAGLGGCGIFGGKKPTETIAGERQPILTVEQNVAVDQATLERPMALPPAFRNEEWPQPGGFTHHAMQHLDLGVEGIDSIWRASVGDGSHYTRQISATPIIAEGKVFALDSSSSVTAVGADNGDRLWRRSLAVKGESVDAGFGGGVAHADGVLYVATGFGNLHALNPSTGEDIWVRAVGIPMRTAPTAAGGRVYVVTADNQFFALSARDGSTLWTYRGIPEIAKLVSDVSPAVLGETVVVPFSSGEVVAFQAQNGRQLWSDLLNRQGRLTSLSSINDIAGRPVIARNRVIAASQSGRLVSLDLRTGGQVWGRNISTIETPWVAGDFIYVVTTAGQVVCLSFEDGLVRWTTQLAAFKTPKSRKGPIRWAGPVVAGNKVILASSHGKLIFLSPETGEVSSEESFGGGTFISPVVSNGRLYILTSGGDVVAFAGRTSVRSATASGGKSGG